MIGRSRRRGEIAKCVYVIGNLVCSFVNACNSLMGYG